MVRWKAVKSPVLRRASVELAIMRGLIRIKKGILADFERTTRTWDRKVKFDARIIRNRRSTVVKVTTDDEIYGYVSGGTKPYTIKPKKATVLKFRGQYKSKTTTGRISSRSGGASGDFVFATEVKHKGIKAREFDEKIRKLWLKKLGKELIRIAKDMAKASGHAMR